jgi:hypothetical protein
MANAGGPTRLRATLRTERTPDDIGLLLRAGGPDRWLGELVADGPPDMRRYATDLRLGQPADGPRGAIRKAAYVDLGPVEQAENIVRVEVSWRSASLAPLFPVFSGWLTVRAGEITIDGRYVPPGGPVGFVADRALMRRAAQYTADWLLGELNRAPTSPSRTISTSPAST